MKKVAIVGLGWLGMPLALSLMARGWQVTGSKTTQDGVEAARMCGIDSYPLRLEPQLVCGAPYSADRLHQFHLGVWQRQWHGERELPASAANRQRAGAQGAGGLAAQPAGNLGGYSASGRAGGAFPSSGTFFCRQVGAGWPARGQSGAFAGCGGRYRTAVAGPEGRAHL